MANNARASHKWIKGSKLIVYTGGPHGITDTHKDQLNQDLLSFPRELFETTFEPGSRGAMPRLSACRCNYPSGSGSFSSSSSFFVFLFGFSGGSPPR
jgi:hypothetical protein